MNMYSIKRICTAQTKAESYLSSATHGMSDEDSGSLQRTPNSTRRGRSAVRTSPKLGQCRSEFGQKQPRRQAGPEKKSDKRSSAGAKISVPLTLAPAGQKIWSDFHQAVPKFGQKSDLSWRPFQKFGQNQAKEVKKRFGQKPGKTGQFRNDIWGYYWGSCLQDDAISVI
ncbi:hypothetical protein CPB85DRAFT_351744 [Mucidula mucida]|nr:hypothetical protein CPB85DRAFT_351744 [Mucidula mucida]